MQNVRNTVMLAIERSQSETITIQGRQICEMCTLLDSGIA